MFSPLWDHFSYTECLTFSLVFHIKLLCWGANSVWVCREISIQTSTNILIYPEGQGGAEGLHSPLTNGSVCCLARCWFRLAAPKGHQRSWSISSCPGTQPDSSSHPLLAEALQSGIWLNSRFMTQRRPWGRPQHGAGRCVCPQPTARQQLPAGPLRCWRAKAALRALPPPGLPFHPVQAPISLSPGVIRPQQHCSRSSVQLPTALPCHRHHVLVQPQPVPGAQGWCPQAGGCPLGRGGGTGPGCRAHSSQQHYSQHYPKRGALASSPSGNKSILAPF